MRGLASKIPAHDWTFPQDFHEFAETFGSLVDQIATMACVSFSKTASAEFSRINGSREMYAIEFNGVEDRRYGRDTRTVVINPRSGLKIKSSGGIQSAAIGGIHAISHAAQHDRIGGAAMAKSQ